MARLQVNQVFKILTPEKVVPRDNCDGKPWDKKTHAVDSYGKGEDELDLAEALWLVKATEMSGGGTGHGPHDVYPDGWGVRAARVTADGDETGETIFFRQSGCFNNMLEEDEVEVVGVSKGSRHNLALMS